jgi:hypothetical protein
MSAHESRVMEDFAGEGFIGKLLSTLIPVSCFTSA